MRAIRVLASVAVAVAIAVTPGTAQAAGPDPGSVYVSSIAYGGTGAA